MCRICLGEIDVKDASLAEYITHKKYHDYSRLFKFIKPLSNSPLLTGMKKELIDKRENR